MRIILSTALALGVTACSHNNAVLVRNPYPWAAYSPTNTAKEIGTVAFKNNDTNGTRDAGRFGAYKLMNQACRGNKFTLVRGPYYQYPSTTWGWQRGFRGFGNTAPAPTAFMDFQCHPN